MVTINLFGGLSVIGEDGAQIPIRGAKTQGLVSYLALNMGMPPSRDRLMALFWGDRSTDQARQSLRQALAKLRRLLETGSPDVLQADPDRVGFNAEKVRVDVEEFTRLASDGSPDAGISAAALVTGPLLEGLYGQHSDLEDWIVSERQRIATLAVRVFERVAETHLRRGDRDEALATARRLVALDPLREASQIVLIRVLAQSGERAAAIQQYQACEATLRAELGVAPGPELQKLMAEIRQEASLAAPRKLEAAPAPAPPLPGASADVSRTAIAVIPFATITLGPEQDYFVEGLTEDVATNLARFRWLDVHAGSRLSGPRLLATDLGAIGQKIGLDYVLHGSLRTHGRKARLTVQLTEPSSARYVWVARYDRECDDLMDVQDELSETIAASVEAELERLAGSATRSLPLEEMGAWDSYHRGLAIQYEFNADTNATAQQCFRRAIELDRNFAAAYARLSYALVISAIYFDAPVDNVMDEALDLARTACRLDPEDAVGRFALGRVYLARGEYDRSLAELQTAIKLNPTMAQAHCALGDSLAYSGALDAAMPCFDEAVRLSPSDPYRWAFLGYGATALLFKGHFRDAADWAARAEAVPNAHYWATATKASALAHAGELEAARAAVDELQRHRPGITCDFVRSRLFYLKNDAQRSVYLEGLLKAGLP